MANLFGKCKKCGMRGTHLICVIFSGGDRDSLHMDQKTIERLNEQVMLRRAQGSRDPYKGIPGMTSQYRKMHESYVERQRRTGKRHDED